MNRMCVQAGFGGSLKPRKHEQRLLRNMGVHKVSDALQISMYWECIFQKLSWVKCIKYFNGNGLAPFDILPDTKHTIMGVHKF